MRRDDPLVEQYVDRFEYSDVSDSVFGKADSS